MKLKVFAVGNSFSANAMRFLPQIVSSVKGCEIIAINAYIGGCPLEKHLNLARMHEADPNNLEGKPYPFEGGNFSLKELLLKEEWDIITIQQASHFSYKPETYRPFAKELCDYIRKYRPEAEMAVHETWAYRADNANSFNESFSNADMYRELALAYDGIAKELGIKRMIPVGDAFQLVDEIPGQTFVKDSSFDQAKAVKPALPKQSPSLHVGWFWGSDDILRYDHGHANVRGEYLGGLVWFGELFGKDPRKVKFVPEGIQKDDAKFLREAAFRTVNGEKPKLSPL